LKLRTWIPYFLEESASFARNLANGLGDNV
jgi:hypothetical protein